MSETPEANPFEGDSLSPGIYRFRNLPVAIEPYEPGMEHDFEISKFMAHAVPKRPDGSIYLDQIGPRIDYKHVVPYVLLPDGQRQMLGRGDVRVRFGDGYELWMSSKQADRLFEYHDELPKDPDPGETTDDGSGTDDGNRAADDGTDPVAVETFGDLDDDGNRAADSGTEEPPA